jgi:hypothetical membrane protein
MQQHWRLGRVGVGGLGQLRDDRAAHIDDNEGLPVTLIAVSSDLPALAAPSLRMPALRMPALRLVISLPRTATATQAGYTTSGFIALGILLSILTTTDPLWWQEHFSRLGTFADFSGAAFNGTIVVSGALVVYFATRLRVEMVRHSGSALLANRRAATVVPVLVGVIGVHLSLVGMFPLNVNEFMHDRGPQGALLAFVVILVSRRWMLKGMHPDVAKTTRRVGIMLAVTITGFATGVLNLAAFELLVFSLMFLWFLMLARNIGRPTPAPAARVAYARRVRAGRAPSVRTRHVGLHAAPTRRVRSVSTRPVASTSAISVTGPARTGRHTRVLPRQRSRSHRTSARSFVGTSDSDHHSIRVNR